MEKIKLEPGMRFYCGIYPFEKRKVAGWYEEIVDVLEDGDYAAAECTDGFGHTRYYVIKWQGDVWEIVDDIYPESYQEIRMAGRI